MEQKEVSGKLKNILNYMKMKTHQNLWDTTKDVLRGIKCIRRKGGLKLVI